MALKVQTTGIEQYVPGGGARLKLMVIGGPGAGKTRMASFYPKPIYLDCEGGLSSVADRRVPFVTVRTSQDMLDALAHLKDEERRPRNDRRYETAVVDTLDAFQRKVKDEWLQANPSADSFSGYDAWGYLDAKMQMLLTRLLNLDMNVVVNVHYKDKTVTEGTGPNKTERHELMLQLQGDVKDSAFNDFDLVGWLGTYWEAEEGERVQKRGLTFTATPERPFLKDRLHITPTWMEVIFDHQDYFQLFSRLTERLDDFAESETVDEIPDYQGDRPVKGSGVVGPMGGGALPPIDPKDMPYDQLKKDELVAKARAIPELADQVKANTLKSELVEMLTAHREAQKAKAREAKEAEAAKADQPRTDQAVEAKQDAGDAAPDEPAEQTPVQAPDVDEGAQVKETRDDGSAVTNDGEILTPEQVAEQLGAEVIDEGEEATSEAESADTSSAPPQEAPAQRQEAKPQEDKQVCEVCGKDLAGENQDYVKLSYIKFRKYLCNEDYQAARAK